MLVQISCVAMCVMVVVLVVLVVCALMINPIHASSAT
jgi:hypothetical protein